MTPAEQSGFPPLTQTPLTRTGLTRRTFLGAGLSGAAVLALAACTPGPSLLSPTSAPVQAAERERERTGRTRRLDLRAAPTEIDLAGVVAATWAYGSAVPASVVRVTKGDRVLARVANGLPDPTTVHWHGLALRNDMDGVPRLTQKPIAAGAEFTYDFLAPDAGTFWFHPHVGAQLDRGLYSALIIDDPDEPLAYDDEWVVVLDDWLDGVTATPDEVFEELSAGMGGMGGMDGMVMQMGNLLMGATSELLGGDAGDVFYPHYLVNGRPAADPETYSGRPGSRVRIRLINAGGDTAFRVALGGHRLTITHTDGFPVEPLEVDSLLIGMGERYDVLVTLGDGVFPFVAEAEGKGQRAFALVRTGGGAPPAADAPVAELTGTVGTAQLLSAAAEVALPSRSPDRTHRLRLTGGMEKYDWSIDDVRFDPEDPLKGVREVREGERVRIDFVNDTEMWHPMHLHGHTYQHDGGGPRKDTSVVLPKSTLRVEFDADNPGRWLVHCHNIYHGEAGMMGAVAYRA